jgi:hypothetical protein
MASHDDFPEVGKILKGTVDRLKDGCAIIELNCGREAVLPFSLSLSALLPGTPVTVKVISVEPHHRFGQKVSVEEV